MRTRTSAVLTLVATLLASPMSGLACLFDCGGSPSALAARTDRNDRPADSVDGSCHRKNDDSPLTSFSLTAAPHDCGSHATLRMDPAVPQLRHEVAPLIGPADLVRHEAIASLIAITSDAITIHDLAPPASASTAVTPLRI